MIKGDTQPNAKDGFSGPEISEMAGRHSAADRPETGGQGCRTLQDPLPGMSPPAGVERGVLGFQQQGLVDQERGRRADPEGREYSDLAYRDRSRAGRRHARPNGRAFPQISASRAAASRSRSAKWSRRPSTTSSTRRSRRRAPQSGSGSTAICRTSCAASWPTRFARSTASGRRRPIFTTARCRPSRICLGDPRNRPKTFYLGSREYDPVKLGYKIDPIDQRLRIRHLNSRQLEYGATNSGRNTARTRKSRA